MTTSSLLLERPDRFTPAPAIAVVARLRSRLRAALRGKDEACDLALACLSRGGIWLAGGTAAKLLEGLRSPTFNQAFLAKGRLAPTLGGIPIRAITDPAVGSFSAACRARALLG